jgi:Domain of unknown function (DUF6487)
MGLKSRRVGQGGIVMAKDPEPVCPKCGEAMEEGYLIDYAHGNAIMSRWVQGKPVPGIIWEVDPTSRKQLGITAFRCRKCGLLESYARGD